MLRKLSKNRESSQSQDEFAGHELKRNDSLTRINQSLSKIDQVERDWSQIKLTLTNVNRQANDRVVPLSARLPQSSKLHNYNSGGFIEPIRGHSPDFGQPGLMQGSFRPQAEKRTSS